MRTTKETFLPPRDWRYPSMTFDGTNGGGR